MTKVIGIDQAINDFIVEVDADFLQKIKIQKGERKKITEKKLEKIMPLIEESRVSAGGSIRNVMRNLASFGTDTGIITAVGNDRLGEIYKESLEGVSDYTFQYPGKTGAAITYITEDRERSFQTFLGVSGNLSERAIIRRIKEGVFDNTKMIVLSGFLFENKNTEIYEAAKYAMAYSNKKGIKIALGLGGTNFLKSKSSRICRLIQENEIEILSMNEEEAKTLTGEKKYISSANALMEYCKLLGITRGREGVLIGTKKQFIEVCAEPLPENKSYNKNGAGDAAFSTIIKEYVSGEKNTPLIGKIAVHMAREAIYSRSASIDQKVDYDAIKKGIKQ